MKQGNCCIWVFKGDHHYITIISRPVTWLRRQIFSIYLAVYSLVFSISSLHLVWTGAQRVRSAAQTPAPSPLQVCTSNAFTYFQYY